MVEQIERVTMKKGYWRGREWIIRAATPEERETISSGASGVLFENAGLILYDSTMPEDLQIQAIIHEVGHVMFPEWITEPNSNSKSELGILERDLKSFLEEFGVDLLPLIEKENEEPSEGVS